MSNTVVPRFPPPVEAKPRPRLRARQLLWGGLGVVGGGVLGYFAVRWLPHLLLPWSSLPRGYAVGLLALIPLGWFAAIAAHELGHLLAALAVRSQFLLFGVGPFIVQRAPAGLRFDWNPRLLLAGGLVACLPKDDRNLRRRLAITVAGGPLASALFTVAAGFAAHTLGRMPGAASVPMLVLAQAGCVWLMLLSGFVTLLASIPTYTAGFKSDGRRLWDLWRPGPHQAHEIALLLIAGASLAGVRPRDYSAAAVHTLQNVSDDSLFALQGRVYVYRAAADRGDWIQAQQQLDRIVAGEAKLPGFLRDLVRLEYAWLLATQTTDAAAARAWLDSANASVLSRATHLRAEAAVLRREGRDLPAVEAAQAARVALVQHALGPVVDPWERESVDALLHPAAPIADRS